MAYPPFYDRQHNFADWQAEHPSDPLPADWLEEELNTAKSSIDGTIDSLKKIQRSDGALANKSVGFDQIKNELRVGVRQPYPWTSGRKYLVDDAVTEGASFYVCVTEHTSGSAFTNDFTAGRWALVLDLGDLTGQADDARDEAVAAADAAQTSRLAAETAAGNAAGYRDAAAASATLAEGYKDGTSRPILFTFDGGGQILQPGLWGFLPVPGITGRIVAARLVADTAGSLVVDVWRTSWASAPPTAANSICGAAKPTLSSAVKAEDTTLSGWAPNFAANDVFAFNVDSVTGVKLATLALTVSLD